MREDGVDAKGRDSDDAREAVDEAERELARVVGDREEGGEDGSLGNDEGDQAVAAL